VEGTSGRRKITCYHEAEHAHGRWFFGHDTERAVVLSVERVLAGNWPVDHKGRVCRDIEGYVDGYGIGPNPQFTPRIADIVFGEETSPEDAEQYKRSLVIGMEMDLVGSDIGATAEGRYRRQSVVACMMEGGDGDLASKRRLLDWEYTDKAAREAARFLAERRASKLVWSASGWRAITAMAEALHENGEITGDEIEDLCCAAYGVSRLNRDGRLLAMHEAHPWPLAMFGTAPALANPNRKAETI
jgi:hypothetical protein